MASPETARPVIRFGAFELVPETGELRKSGVRLRLAEQPIRILLCLLDHPGEAVTREELRSLLWGGDTFVDFEHGLNAAINRLREALGDSAANPRFIETVPRRGYRFIGEVQRTVPRPPEEAWEIPQVLHGDSTPIPAWVMRDRNHLRWTIPLLLIAISSTTGWWWSTRAGPPEFTMRPFTSGSGLSMTPAISPDGTLIAYASDRATGRSVDLWVQPLAGGAEPLRLTTHEADDLDPSFSPDGGLIAFQSSRDGGGAYVIPVLGGQERLLAPGGRGPRFSPDGRWIAVTLSTGGLVSGSTIQVVPVAGGPARQVAADVPWATNPVFSPDGRHLVCVGASSSNALTSEDWWVAPVEGGIAQRTGFADTLRKQGLDPFRSSGTLGVIRPEQWIGNRILFLSSGHLWDIPITPGTWKFAGPARQLTSGASVESHPSATANPGKTRIVFSVLNETPHLWRLRLHPNEGTARSGPEELRRMGGEQVYPTASADGRTLVYVQNEPSAQSVRARDLVHGKEAVLLSRRYRPKLSPDGTTVAFSDALQLSVVPASGGETTAVIQFSERGNVFGWSPDGKKIVYWEGTPIRFMLVDPASQQTAELISHAKFDIHDAALSPDQRWVAFHTPMPRNTVLRIAPVRNGRAAGEAEWITVMDRPAAARRPWWSPNGRLLYFLSDFDGSYCVYAQRLEAETKRPAGGAFPVYHFHEARNRILQGPLWGPAILPDGIIFAMWQQAGNIWLAEEK